MHRWESRLQETARVMFGLALGSGTGFFLNLNMMACWGFGLAWLAASLACTGLLLGLVVQKTGWAYRLGLTLAEVLFVLLYALWTRLSGL